MRDKEEAWVFKPLQCLEGHQILSASPSNTSYAEGPLFQAWCRNSRDGGWAEMAKGGC